jgi:DNA-binding response OmpR family regulator
MQDLQDRTRPSEEVRRDVESAPSRANAQEEVQLVIVEDDDDALEALMTLVELDGYRAEGAGSAEEALEITAHRTPQCVILDLGLPGVDGTELARQLRSRFGSGMVLIGVTGNTDADVLSAAEEAGVDYLLSKPLDIERFRRIVPPLR